MTRIDVRLINLASSTERLSLFAAQADREGMPFERVDAVDMRGKQTTPEQNAAALRSYGRALGAGEVGCFLSHIKAMEAFLATDADVLLICEDDAELVPGFWRVVQDVAQDLVHPRAPDWWMVCLGNSPKRKYRTPLCDYGKFSLVRALSYPVLSHAQLVSREGAASLVPYKTRVEMPVDQVFVRSLSRAGTGFAMDPPIARQAGLASDIDALGQREGDPVAVMWRKWLRKWKNRLDAERFRRSKRASDLAWCAELESERQIRQGHAP